MGAEITRTELRVSRDPRLRAGVRAALEHIGARHGLSKAEQGELSQDVLAECRKSLEAQSAETRYCCVVIDELEDRLEVRVQYLNSPSANENSRGSVPAKNSNSRNPENGHQSATFVKHFHKSAAHR